MTPVTFVGSFSEISGTTVNLVSPSLGAQSLGNVQPGASMAR
jgi:hypothetical protein